jgi:hypothetical protein
MNRESGMSPRATLLTVSRWNGQPVLSLQDVESVKQCLGQVMAEISASSQDLPTGALDVQDPITFEVNLTTPLYHHLTANPPPDPEAILPALRLPHQRPDDQQK